MPDVASLFPSKETRPNLMDIGMDYVTIQYYGSVQVQTGSKPVHFNESMVNLNQTISKPY
jgi:hypothetical protein